MSTPTIDPELAAEHAVIGALLQTTETLRTRALDVLEDSDFDDLRCRFAISVIRRMVAAETPIDQLTLHAYVRRHGLLADRQLRGSLAVWLSDRCSEVPTPASVVYYATDVAQTGCRRVMREAANRITAAVSDAALADAERISDEATEEIIGAWARLREVMAGE